jgi:plastocyanin
MRDRLILPIAIPVGSLIVIGIVLFIMSRVLLGVPHALATPIALLVAVAILLLFTYLATGADISRGQIFGGIAVLTLMGAASAPYLVLVGERMAESIRVSQEEAASHNTGLPPNEAELVAKGSLNVFDKTKITLSGEGPFVIHFNNQDPGLLHNWALYQSKGGAPIYQGANVTGPAAITYSFPPPAPGDYYYQCDIHPTTMMGTATVK